MKIALKGPSISCCREVLRQTKSVQEQAECIVPDVYEDIGKITFAQAQLYLKSKEAADHGVNIGVAADVSVFYITERRDRVRCLSFSKSFEIAFDSQSIVSEGDIRVSLRCMGVQARAVNPRKVSAQLSVRAEISCLSENCTCIPAEAEEAPQEPAKKYGFVAVSLGNGFSQFFHDLNVDQIVEGGQTMNPSVDDLLSAIKQVNAECVFVLPNNGNVIFAANQAAELSDKEVRVIPTKNVAMGIAAAIAFQNDANPDENMEKMNEAAQHVKTAMVTYAIRDSEYNGIEIKQGDIIGLHNGQIEFSGSSIHDVVLDMMKQIITDEDELITVYYGADVTEEDAKQIAEEIESQYGDCDVEYHNGGQPLYYYLISVE